MREERRAARFPIPARSLLAELLRGEELERTDARNNEFLFPYNKQHHRALLARHDQAQAARRLLLELTD